jgi:hypothetical protein
MSNLNGRVFFRLWEDVQAASNPGRQRDNWEVAGATCTRERHSYHGSSHSMQIEVHRLVYWGGRGSSGWEILVITERWWDPHAHNKAIRDTTWCRLLKGQARDVFTWFKMQSEIAAKASQAKLPTR